MAIKPSSPVLPMASKHAVESEAVSIKKSIVMLAPEEEQQWTETVLVSAAASCCSSPQQKRSIVMFAPEDEEINPSMCSVTVSVNSSPKESYKSKAKLRKEREGKENEMQGSAMLVNNRKNLTKMVDGKSHKLRGRDNNNSISRKYTPLVAIN